ncbi:MAG: hypothetical protein M1818_007147 [Claussenomyces sp. TS43310]|nr:MAG: hypothetical protein M1818_007147 [Claussenomyces sp. TS43310]
MDVKHVQAVQCNHADRLLRLEKRQVDDAALKSVWNSPFPSVLGGTPQHGPLHTPSADIFDDFDDGHGQNLLGNLHIETDDEPVRRGASRTNGVRFDVSAIHGSNWADSRSSEDFCPARPTSGFGSHPVTERSYSYKSDGRHSSAGHSVHSIHSAPSGRTSSLGLDTRFLIGGQEPDSPLEIPEPPPGLFILGSVPSIIRCWLSEDFSHGALLYAVLCTGSQKSTIESSLIRDIGLADQVQKNAVGKYHITLTVYLPEAIVTQPLSRTNSPARQLPTLIADFEITGMSQRYSSERKRGIRIFLGSDTLRAHSADLSFSQNVMRLYSDDRNKITVPFVRPEDDDAFKNLYTADMSSEKIELKATAIPFTPNDHGEKDDGRMCSNEDVTMGKGAEDLGSIRSVATPSETGLFLSGSPIELNSGGKEAFSNVDLTNGKNSIGAYRTRHDRGFGYSEDSDSHRQDTESANRQIREFQEPADLEKGESPGGIWGSWRSGSVSHNGNDTTRETIPWLGYNRSGRGGRSTKVLKPSKVAQQGRSSTNARTGHAYEPPRAPGESRRKSQGFSDSNGRLRLESKRITSGEEKTATAKEPKLATGFSRSTNPVGVASAFAWMNSMNPNASSSISE